MDVYDNIKALVVAAPVAIGTTGTGQVGKIIDRAGYQGVVFFVSYGTLTATNAVFTATMKEGDVTGTMTTVTAANIVGTLAGAGIAAGTPRTSGVSKNVVKKVGYIGIKRYVQLGVSSTITAGTPVGVIAVLGRANTGPI
jgi:hypothetical protein